jgi:ATP-dependent helicase/nuclease subunit A
VGDKKQSIYSFQGADPGAFDRMQTRIRRTAGDASGAALRTETLAHSFRSSPSDPAPCGCGVRDDANAGFDPDASHIAFRPNLPGGSTCGRPCPRPARPTTSPGTIR